MATGESLVPLTPAEEMQFYFGRIKDLGCQLAAASPCSGERLRYAMVAAAAHAMRDEIGRLQDGKRLCSLVVTGPSSLVDLYHRSPN